MNILNKKFFSFLSAILWLLVILLVLYLVFSPFYPALKYKIDLSSSDEDMSMYQDLGFVAEKSQNELNKLPKNDNLYQNRIMITKIGVNAPIIESSNETYGLDKGAWRMPDSSTPDKGGNTIITGHRFKYLPPNNLTFYLLNKVESGDLITVVWNKTIYYYRVKDKKIVNNDDLSVLKKTDENILTVFTCDPIFSEEHRLVITSEFAGNSPYLNTN